MNWDERLKEARARRAKIMESKHTETVQKGQTLFNPPDDDGDEKLEKLRLAARGQLPRQPKRAPIAVKSRRTGLVPLVFGIGILLGVGATQLPVFMSDEPPAPADIVVLEETAQVAPPIEPVPVPETTAEVSVELAAPASITDQASVLPEVGLDVASVRSGRPKNLPVWTAPARPERPAFVVAAAIDLVPRSQLPPGPAAPVVAAPAASAEFEFLVSVAPPNSIELAELAAGLDIQPIEVVSRARSVQGLEVFSLSNTVPVSLESASSPILDRTVNETAAAPLVEETIARPIWIFAPTSVGEEILDSTQSAAGRLNFSVQAVNRVAYRISRSQVRYYDPDSAEAAARLAEEIGAIPRDFTTSDVTAAPGTLEVYLAGRSAAARSQSATAARREAPANDVNSLRNSVLGRIRAGLSN